MRKFKLKYTNQMLLGKLTESTLDIINDFKKSFLEIGEAVTKLRELERLTNLGEISKGASNSLKKECMENLKKYCEKFTKLENELDAVRAKTLLELESSRRKIEELGLPTDPNIEKFEAIFAKIKNAYFSMKVQIGLEAFQYICSLRADIPNKERSSHNNELCQNFLDSLAKGWLYQKEHFQKYIESLEKQVNELEKQENELNLRIRIGEITDLNIKEKIGQEIFMLQKKISDASNFINIIDSRIFDCYLILSGQGSSSSIDLKEVEMPSDLLNALDIASTIEIDGKILSIEDAYYSALFKYSLRYGFGSMAAKDRLEKDIKGLIDKGLSRSEAIASILKQGKVGR